VYNTDR